MASNSLSPKSKATVLLHPRVYHAVWRLGLVLHIGHGVGYSWVFKTYVHTLLTAEIFDRLLRLVGLGEHVKTDVAIAVTILAFFLSGWHLLAASSMLRASWRHRAYMWQLPSTNDGKKSCFSSCLSCVRPFFVGVGSQYFDLVFMIRKTIELISQAYQIVRMTGSLPYPWIHHVAVVMLVINCWASTLIRYLPAHYDQHPLTNRFILLIANILATSFFTFVLPFLVYMVYKSQRDFWRWFDPIWVANVRGSLQQSFINTWIMCVFSTLPQLTLIIALENVKSVARDKTTETIVTPYVHRRSTIVSSGRRLRDVLSALFGICVVVAHVHAYTRPAPPATMCDVPMQPWSGHSQHACAAVDFNCHRLQVNGQMQEIDRLLDQFDASMVLALMFRHCPQLEIPPRVQSLMNLVFFEIYNSTLVEWSAEAALTTTTHPRLASVYLVSVSNMTQWPLGLLQPTMPATNVQVYQTDLSSFPDNMLWSSVLYMVFLEQSNLTQVPAFLLGPSSSNVIELSLSGNAITQVPAALLTKPALTNLWLNQNAPLHEFTGDCAASRLLKLEIQLTNVTQVPDCVTATTVTAYGSPICADDGPAVDCVFDASAPLVRFPIEAFAHDRRP